MTLDHAAQSGRHAYIDRGADFYPTPPQAIAALLTVEKLPRCLCDVCAGNGGIARPLRKLGYQVIASDIIARDFRLNFTGDFLTTTKAPPDIETILSNPPYGFAEQFITHALELCPHVIMLLRLAFLESERRTEILEHSGLARVHVFRRRLPMMHRHGWSGPRASNAIPFAWFIWSRDHIGPATISRISWEDAV
jgi:predicted RNA methylase